MDLDPDKQDSSGDWTLDDLDALLEASPVAIFALTPEGLVTQWNRAAQEIFGYGPEEVLGQPLPIIPPEEQAAFLRVVQQVMGGKPFKDQVVRRRRKDGTQLDVRLSSAPLRDPKGRIAGVLGIAQDVTAQLQAERDQRERLHQLQVLLDAIPAPIFFKDERGIYAGCNRAFEEYLGKSRAQIVGMSVYDVAPRDLADVYRKADEDLMSARGVQVYEASVAYADGSRRDVIFHKAAFPKADGSLGGLVGTMMDISARKLAEKDLAEQAARSLANEAGFRSLLERLPEAVVIWQQGEVAFANAAAHTLAGEAGLEGLLALALREPGSPGLTFEGFLQRGASSGPHEALLPRPGGQAVELEVSAAPLTFTDARAVAVVARDVTERKQMERRLLQADRLATVGTLAAGVAHEINNPLAFIYANLAFVRRQLAKAGGALEPEVRVELEQAVAEAQEGAERVQHIVRDLKTFSRSDGDPQEPLELRPIIESAANMAGGSLRQRVRLVTAFAPEAWVQGNRIRLGQVFLNLLVNAVQAMPERPLEQGEVRVSTRVEGEWVVAEVADNGSGIDPALLPRIFDPFFTTKPVGVGTGLGLSICHGIVAQLGGRIDAESALGQGSTFRVVLPRCAARPSAPPVRPGLRVPARRGRVLVLDDEPLIAATFRRVLGAHHEVHAALDGREALSLLGRLGAVDAIFCDVVMPGMSGFEFREAVAERHPALLERLVFISGGSLEAVAAETPAVARHVRLEKPFASDAVWNLVCDLIARADAGRA